MSYIGVTRFLYIPYVADGKPFTKIAPYAFANNAKLKGVDISSSITNIGNHAFDGCTALGRVYIPSADTAIEGQPFCGGTDFMLILKNPSKAYDWANSNHVPYIEDNTDESSDPDDFEFSKPDEYGGVSITGYKGSEGDIVIPSRCYDYPVTAIGDHAFAGCDSVTTVEIGRASRRERV